MSNKSFQWLETFHSSNNFDGMKTQSALISDSTQDSVAAAPQKTQQQEEAEAQVWQGIKLEQEHKLAEAIARYRDAVELNSQSTVAHHVLAIALKKQGNFAEADYYHRLAISLGQNNQTDTPKSFEKHNLNSESTSPIASKAQENTSSIVKSDSSVVLPKLTAITPGSYVENSSLEVAQVYLQQAKIYYNNVAGAVRFHKFPNNESEMTRGI